MQTQTLSLLVQALADENWEVRAEAIKTLGTLGNPEAVPALIEALGDPDPRVRDEAVCALGNIGDRRAVPALINTLRNDDDDAVRVAAAYILGELGDPSAVEPLKEALLYAIREKDWGMWVAADWALDALMKTQPITHQPTETELHNPLQV